MYLLSFGSGYEAALQEACRVGWQECMQFGVLGMHISGNKLDAEYLSVRIDRGGLPPHPSPCVSRPTATYAI